MRVVPTDDIEALGFDDRPEHDVALGLHFDFSVCRSSALGHFLGFYAAGGKSFHHADDAVASCIRDTAHGCTRMRRLLPIGSLRRPTTGRCRKRRVDIDAGPASWSPVLGKNSLGRVRVERHSGYSCYYRSRSGRTPGHPRPEWDSRWSKL